MLIKNAHTKNKKLIINFYRDTMCVYSLFFAPSPQDYHHGHDMIKMRTNVIFIFVWQIGICVKTI